jgi:hypothetical protein
LPCRLNMRFRACRCPPPSVSLRPLSPLTSPAGGGGEGSACSLQRQPASQHLLPYNIQVARKLLLPLLSC